MNDKDLDLSYIELQAYMGTTKHLGSLATTLKEFVCVTSPGGRVGLNEEF